MNPFDLTGPDFLALYIVLLIGGSVLALVTQWYLRLPGGEPEGDALNLSPYEVAYLAGGENLAGTAVIARMAQDGILKADIKLRKITIVGELPSDASSVEQAVYASAGRNSKGDYSSTICANAGKSMQPLRDRLESVGLIVSPSQNFNARIASVGIILIVLAMGVVKIFVGISRNRPVGFLVILCYVTAMIAFYFFKKSLPHRSRRGDITLKRLKTTNAALRYQLVRQTHQVSSQNLAMSLGLFGIGVLAGSPLTDLERVLSRPVVQPSFFASSGSSGGSSSCGGGGGCGGGGCGGCGG